MILDKNVYKKIEYYLYNYEMEHEQLELVEDDIILGVKTGFIDGGRSNQVSSKTENSALKLIENRKDYEWLDVIQATLTRFKGTEHEAVISLTYKEQYKLPKILRLMNLERTAYYDRKNDVIMYAALKATERGLINH
jgi:hypothetical protein